MTKVAGHASYSNHPETSSTKFVEPDGIPQATQIRPDVPSPTMALFARTIPARKLIVLAFGSTDPAG